MVDAITILSRFRSIILKELGVGSEELLASLSSSPSNPQIPTPNSQLPTYSCSKPLVAA